MRMIAYDGVLSRGSYEGDVIAIDGCKHCFAQIIYAIWNKDLCQLVSWFDVCNEQSI